MKAARAASLVPMYDGIGHRAFLIASSSSTVGAAAHNRHSLSTFRMQQRRTTQRLSSTQLLQVRLASTFKLQEVGKFEDPKTEQQYDAGQFFLHRVFGYRGVVLFPWVARVFDRDLHSRPAFNKPQQQHSPPTTTTLPDSAQQQSGTSYSSTFSTPMSSGQQRGEVKAQSECYYQALMDTRDTPFIRSQPEAVTYLGQSPDSSNRALYAIPGLDYVSHSDVLPYICTGAEIPLANDLFQKFLGYDSDKGIKGRGS